MDDTNSDTGLLLPDLSIENFRGIRKLSISRLGRVTLFAGRNGVGLTTVLDAIRVYAARGRHQAIGPCLGYSRRNHHSQRPKRRWTGSSRLGGSVPWTEYFRASIFVYRATRKDRPAEVSRQLSLIMSIQDFHICRVNSCNAFQDTGFEHSWLNASCTAIYSFRLAMVGVYRALTSCSQRLSTNLWGRGSWRDPIWPDMEQSLIDDEERSPWSIGDLRRRSRPHWRDRCRCARGRGGQVAGHRQT